jgi:outer membrane protein assembly factor BamA
VYCSVFQACTLEDQRFLRERRPFAALILTAARRRVSPPIDPRAGTSASVTLMHSSPLLGSDPFFEFNRVEGELAWYKPVGRRGVLAWRVWAGTVIPHLIQLTADTSRFIPPEQRLYAGGPTTVRGYSPNGLGPRVYVTRDTTSFDPGHAANGDTVYTDLVTSPTGGSTAAVANVELRVPAPVFSARMHLTFFLDVGQVWDQPDPYFRLRDLRVTPGVGLRFATPLGPVRLDFGYNGYQPQAGPLMFETDSTIVRIRDSYQLPRSARFFDRVQVQIAVGPTF